MSKEMKKEIAEQVVVFDSNGNLVKGKEFLEEIIRTGKPMKATIICNADAEDKVKGKKA